MTEATKEAAEGVVKLCLVQSCGLPAARAVDGRQLRMCSACGFGWENSPEFERAIELDFEDRGSHRGEVAVMDYVRRIEAEARNGSEVAP